MFTGWGGPVFCHAAILSLLLSQSVERLPRGVELQGPKGVVLAPSRARALLFFIDPECPVSNGYAPEMARIARLAMNEGIVVLGIHSDPAMTPAKASAHAREHGLGMDVAIDPDQHLAKAAGVRVVPQAVLADAEGRVVYRGRIDDLRTADGKRRPAATRHDLREALAAFIAGKPVPAPGGEAFGCPLPEVSKKPCVE